MKSKFNQEPTPEYLQLVNEIRKSDKGANFVYAEAVHKEKENALVKKYGSKSRKCFCRVYRDRCQKKDGICDFEYVTKPGSWKDHCRLYFDGDKYTLVSEPYGISREALSQLNSLSEEYDLEVTIDARDASWFPSTSTAIIIRKA